jgi:hypothetical protein
LSDEVNNLVAALEDFFNWVVHDKVEVALAVPSVLVEHVLLTVALGKHVQAVGELLDGRWANRELTSLSAAGEALDTNDVTTLNRLSQDIKIASVIGSIAEKLNFLLVSLEIDEDELGTRLSHVHDTASDGNFVFSFFHKHAIFGEQGFILGTELVNAQGAMELMGVGVHVSITLSLEPVLAILIVFRGVELLLRFLLLFWLVSSSLRLLSLLGCFLSIGLTLLLSLLELTLADLFASHLVEVSFFDLFLFLGHVSVNFLSFVDHCLSSLTNNYV